MGALDGQAFKSKVLSYEGPFGVGYCVASFEPENTDNSRRLMDKLRRNNELGIRRIRKKRMPMYVWPENPLKPIYVPERLWIWVTGCRIPCLIAEQAYL